MSDLFQRIKFAWQRAFRGWDDSAKWSLRDYLSSIAIPVLDYMIKNPCGCPALLDYDTVKEGEEKWTQILKDIKWGFEAMDELGRMFPWDGKKFKRLQKERKKGLKLFAEYFGALWT